MNVTIGISPAGSYRVREEHWVQEEQVQIKTFLIKVLSDEKCGAWESKILELDSSTERTCVWSDDEKYLAHEYKQDNFKVYNLETLEYFVFYTRNSDQMYFLGDCLFSRDNDSIVRVYLHDKRAYRNNIIKMGGYSEPIYRAQLDLGSALVQFDSKDSFTLTRAEKVYRLEGTYEDLFVFDDQKNTLLQVASDHVSYFSLSDERIISHQLPQGRVLRKTFSPDKSFVVLTYADKVVLVNKEGVFLVRMTLSPNYPIVIEQNTMCLYNGNQKVSLDACFSEKYKREILNGIVSQESSIHKFSEDRLYDRHLSNEIMKFLKF